jgi:hypothetical protein
MTTIDKIYCYVSDEGCGFVRTADLGDEINNKPVAECGDYNSWTLDEEETNALVFSASGYRFQAARAVQKEMGWTVTLDPIREQLRQELTRIIGRDNEQFTASDVMSWMYAGVDEENFAKDNGFEPVAIAENMAKWYVNEQEANEQEADDAAEAAADR